MKDENGDLSYLVSMNSTQRLTDHLGSVVAITDDDGDLVSQQRYLPFGGVRTNIASGPIVQTDYGYTGQRNLDEDIGLMDYKARFYSPVLNRFIQPDSIVPNPMNPQMFNRFSYVGNSPINFNDPSGHVPVDCYGTTYCGAGNSDLLPDFKSSKPKPPLCQTRACDPNIPKAIQDLQEWISNCSNNTFLPECSVTPPSPYVFPGNYAPTDQPSSESGYCGNGPNAIYNTFDCLANITQDAALFVDIPFALLEIGLMSTLCWGGPKACVGAIYISRKIYTVPNIVESRLGLFSMGFSIAADVSDGDYTTWESSATAITTWGLGNFSKDPVIDAGIDGYGSLYNHGVWPGVCSLFTSNPIC